MKKIIAITTVVLLSVCLSTTSALAGAARRHTIEGFMIGTGVAILGSAIINGINRDSRPQYTQRYSRHGEYRHSGYRNRHRNNYPRRFRHQKHGGYWEVQRIWIDPVYEKKWNPGHYNRHGEWVNGRHEKFLIANGYWQKEKLWVRH